MEIRLSRKDADFIAIILRRNMERVSNASNGENEMFAVLVAEYDKLNEKHKIAHAKDMTEVSRNHEKLQAEMTDELEMCTKCLELLVCGSEE